MDNPANSKNEPQTDQEIKEALETLVLSPSMLELMDKAREMADARWEAHIRKVLLTIAAKEMEGMARRLRDDQLFERDEEVAVSFMEILWQDLEIVAVNPQETESKQRSDEGYNSRREGSSSV